jgi:hypothetical protein
MTKRTERAPRTQAENGVGAVVAHLVEPMLAGMTTTRDHLLAWVHAHGLAALDAVFREEAVALAGPKGRQQAARTHHHWARRRRSSPSAVDACKCGAPGCAGRPAGKRPCRPWRCFGVGTR